MKGKTIKPMGNLILIRRHKSEEKQKGILLLESTQKKQHSGEILAVGPGKRDASGHHLPMYLRVGEHVLFPQYGGTRIDDDTDDLYIFSEDEILAVIYE